MLEKKNERFLSFDKRLIFEVDGLIEIEKEPFYGMFCSTFFEVTIAEAIILDKLCQTNVLRSHRPDCRRAFSEQRFSESTLGQYISVEQIVRLAFADVARFHVGHVGDGEGIQTVDCRLLKRLSCANVARPLDVFHAPARSRSATP